ncbi:hypothetical protein [Thermomonas flagellata]|uniref:hypothetical protein n=1 Tax=Thermomonas flagellata TaxID=2888524 RepID=UPI001F03DC51|nr:hypothetical protein [Thermomonas flagellata]
MGKFEHSQDRARELIGELGDGIRKALPGRALQWIETGAALGALRTGGKVAGKVVRRHPVLAGAAIAGVGLLWFAARQRAKRRAQAPLEGQATRIEAQRMQPRAPAEVEPGELPEG